MPGNRGRSSGHHEDHHRLPITRAIPRITAVEIPEGRRYRNLDDGYISSPRA